MRSDDIYTPQEKQTVVCKPGEFVFAAVALEHGHIYSQCNGLRKAGGEMRWVYDSDPKKILAFQQSFPKVKVARSLEEILADDEVRLITAAAIPSERAALGWRVLEAGKDYFTDKAPFTTLEQLEQTRTTVARTGQKYMVYYSERLCSECAVFAEELIAKDVIGRVLQVLGTGPHRLYASLRAPWFFQMEKTGGILCDIGSHQCEQFLFFAGAKRAQVNFSAVANFSHPEYPEFQDFGEASLTADNGTSGYFRCDWFTPDGLQTWGDGRTFILGTDGTIELRKYTNVASGQPGGDHLYVVDRKGEHYIPCAGKVGTPFFGRLIRDCLERTETAMTQEHTFKAAELSLQAQQMAIRLDTL